MTKTLEDIKKLYETLLEKTIFALELETPCGRFWIYDTDDVLQERLNNLGEDEFFSDYDVCTKQEDPICKEFYEYTYNNYSMCCKLGTFQTRFLFPYWLQEKEYAFIEEIKSMDKSELELLVNSFPKEYTLKYTLVGYAFSYEQDGVTFTLELPYFLSLSKNMNEKFSIRMNYNFGEKKYGCCYKSVAYDELASFLEKSLERKFQEELVS